MCVDAPPMKGCTRKSLSSWADGFPTATQMGYTSSGLLKPIPCHCSRPPLDTRGLVQASKLPNKPSRVPHGGSGPDSSPPTHSSKLSGQTPFLNLTLPMSA